MITSNTYMSRTDVKQDFLAAFTSIDHSVSATLTEAEVTQQFRRLLMRLCALCFLHGRQVPLQFLTALGDASLGAAFDLTNSYIELGQSNVDGNSNYILQRRELQQEIVHFSRIVDIPVFDKSNQFSDKRLRNSEALPDSLKVLTELITVMKSRIRQRNGMDSESRVLRSSGHFRHYLSQHSRLYSAKERTVYTLIVTSGLKRYRRQLAFQFESLLNYLTPSEAAIALWAYWGELTLKENVELVILERLSDGFVNVIAWQFASQDEPNDPISWCARQLPFVDRVLPVELIPKLTKQSSNLNNSDFVGLALINEAEYQNSHLRLVFRSDDPITPTIQVNLEQPSLLPIQSLDDMLERVRCLVVNILEREVRSIECGHIHLDRSIDIDQSIGIGIGAELFRLLASTQTQPPFLAPMVDDDHVLIQLQPSEYFSFFKAHIGQDVPFELIPESSPIIRAITVALFGRLKSLPAGLSIKQRGGNLYLPVDSTICELFEDYDGRCDNGCAFFETGLLLYRSSPESFKNYFAKRFPFALNLHEKIFDILNGKESHDQRAKSLQVFYEHFSEVTNPKSYDLDFTSFTRDVIASLPDECIHVNVLEDYYEVQQRKVRALLRALDMPIRLVTVHFNTLTSRLHMDM